MTATTELARHARAVIPQAGTTGWRITTEAAGYAVVPIIGGRADGRPVFRGSQRDCMAIHRLLTGDPTPRPAAAEPAPQSDGLHRQPDQLLTEAPVPAAAPGGPRGGAVPGFATG